MAKVTGRHWARLLAINKEIMMIDVHINRIHNGAVCKEIGDRLSLELGPQSIALPPHLLELMEQIAEEATDINLGQGKADG